MLNVIPMVTTKKTVTEYTEKEMRIETCQYIYAQFEHKIHNLLFQFNFDSHKERIIFAVQDQARESANCFENSIAILIKHEVGGKRDEIAHIKFIDAVVRAKSPNLSG